MGSRFMVYWRVYVYTNNLYSLPASESRGYRECTPLTYRRNSAEVHRVLCFANRELSVLLRNEQWELLSVFDVLHELILEVNMRSFEFFATLSSFLGSKTNHFLHELINFARSPYDDLISYECNVQYRERTMDIGQYLVIQEPQPQQMVEEQPLQMEEEQPLQLEEQPQQMEEEQQGMQPQQQEQDMEPQQQQESEPLQESQPKRSMHLVRNFVEFSRCVDEDEYVGISAELEAEDELPDEIEELTDLNELNAPLLMELRRLLAERNAADILRNNQQASQLINEQATGAGGGGGGGGTAAAGAGAGTGTGTGTGAAATAVAGTTGSNSNFNANVNVNPNAIITLNSSNNITAAAAVAAAAAGVTTGNDLGLEVAIERSIFDRMNSDYYMPRRSQQLFTNVGHSRNTNRNNTDEASAASTSAAAAAAAAMARASQPGHGMRLRTGPRPRGSGMVPKRRRTANRDLEHRGEQ